MPRTQVERKTFTYDFDVVGLGFRLKADAREELAATIRRNAKVMSKGGAGITGVKLRREQENKYDINAIAVYYPDRGALAGKHLGYLRADTAAIIAPLMDDGKEGGLVFLRASIIGILDGKRPNEVLKITATFTDHR